MAWSPELYEKFKTERYAPFVDTFQLIEARDGLQVLDLGCGTGELTALLAARLPGSELLGIDSSPEMIACAVERTKPNLRFALCEIEQITGSWDLLFSHSALQWVDDHRSLIGRLFSLVNYGGQLVAQFPAHFDHPIQQKLRQVAADEPFRSALNGWTRYPDILSLSEYADLLYPHCNNQFAVYAKIYPCFFSSVEGVIEWARGTSLTPYLARLPEALHGNFLACYQNELEALYSERPIMYAFQRILLAGKRVHKIE